MKPLHDHVQRSTVHRHEVWRLREPSKTNLRRARLGHTGKLILHTYRIP